MNTKIFLILSILICSSFAAFIPVVYKQNDTRWVNEKVGTGTKTIGEAGSLLTAVASIAAGEGVKSGANLFTPSTMNTWLKQNKGFEKGDQFIWESIRPLGFEFENFTDNAIEVMIAISRGKVVILNVEEGHYVVPYIIVTGGFIVMDTFNPGKQIYSSMDVVKAGIYNWNPKMISNFLE